MFKIGVDLGGTNISVGVVDEKNRIVGRGKVKTKAKRSPEEIFADMAKAVDEAMSDAGIKIDSVKSIGIGAPGTVDKANGVIVFANNIYFHHVPARALLQKYFDVDVFLDNDANCAALGEAIAGAGNGKKNFVAITLGTGVGSGVIIDGKIVTGCNDAGGECGHMVLQVDGESCTCGRNGCWEAYASATALIRQTKEAMLNDKDSVMWQLAGGNIENVNGRTAFDAMRMKDKTAKDVVDRYIKYVAVGTVNIVNALQPEMLCFGGGICNEGDTLLEPIREYVRKERYSRYSDKQTVICRAILGNDAGIIGAALLNE
ncbi:MAG: ROK family protein [Oscillospiraceae bacterium]|nr:ROK family protein [Oscillospiraceae bacterium]